MPPHRCLLIYLGAVLIGGALLAPWLYWLTESIPALHELSQKPFHRFVNRSMLGLALIGLYPFLKAIGIRRWKKTGLSWPPHSGRLLQGASLGFATLATVAALALLFDARGLRPNLQAPTIVAQILKAALTAGVVALLEELLFRGSLFGALRTDQRWIPALLLSSAVYSLVHFFQRPPQPESVNWLTGLTTLGAMLHGFVQPDRLIPGFLSLMLAGSMLALAYQRTGNLYFSIGLHAGWIFWLKFYGVLTKARPDTNTWLWGTQKLTDGWLALLILALAFALLCLFLPQSRTCTNTLNAAPNRSG